MLVEATSKYWEEKKDQKLIDPIKLKEHTIDGNDLRLHLNTLLFYANQSGAMLPDRDFSSLDPDVIDSIITVLADKTQFPEIPPDTVLDANQERLKSINAMNAFVNLEPDPAETYAATANHDPLLGVILQTFYTRRDGTSRFDPGDKDKAHGGNDNMTVIDVLAIPFQPKQATQGVKQKKSTAKLKAIWTQSIMQAL